MKTKLVVAQQEGECIARFLDDCNNSKRILGKRFTSFGLFKFAKATSLLFYGIILTLGSKIFNQFEYTKQVASS